MSDELPQRQHGNWSKEYETVRSGSAPSQGHQVLCAERAKLLLGCYRRNDANDPDIYVQAITTVLTKYPAAIVEWATDPRTGIQATEQFKTFPPNSGEVKAFCDAEVRRIHEAGKAAPRVRPRDYVPPSREPGAWARMFVGVNSPNYAAAKVWAELPNRDPREFRFANWEGHDGVWVTHNGYHDEIHGGAVRGWKKPTLDEQYAEVGRAEAEYQKQARAETAP